MFERAKRRTYGVLEKAAEGDGVSRAFDLFIMALIVLNILMVMLETVESIAIQFGTALAYFEVFSASGRVPQIRTSGVR